LSDTNRGNGKLVALPRIFFLEVCAGAACVVSDAAGASGALWAKALSGVLAKAMQNPAQNKAKRVATAVERRVRIFT
jgi:hypothetical protein